MTATGWFTDPRYDAGLEELARLDRAEAVAFAARCRVLAQLAARTTREGWQGQAPFDSLVLDVAGTCRLGQVAAGSRLADAEHLVVRLPGAFALLQAGALRVPQAQVFVEQTRTLSPLVCAEVERRVLPHADGLCPADLRRLLTRTVLEVDAEAVARREAEARRGRRTWVRPAEDGMALFCALLPAEQAAAVQAGLSEQASRARTEGDDRTVDQLRADLLLHLCTQPAPSQPAAGGARRRRRPRSVRVVVHVPLAVAQATSDAAAHLEGYGPLSAAHARRLLPGAELWRACTDPDTGRVWAVQEADPHTAGPLATPRTPALSAPTATPPTSASCAPTATDPTSASCAPTATPPTSASCAPTATDPATPPAPPSAPSWQDRRRFAAELRALADLPPPEPLPPEPQHDPSAQLARLVRARDTRCDGPGCSVPAPRCELDHEVPWPSGPTSYDNVVTRSQRCHHAKHAGWSVERGADGTTWTSPGGRSYLVPLRRALAGPTPQPPPGPRCRRAAALRELDVLLLSVDELDLSDALAPASTTAEAAEVSREAGPRRPGGEETRPLDARPSAEGRRSRGCNVPVAEDPAPF